MSICEFYNVWKTDRNHFQCFLFKLYPFPALCLIENRIAQKQLVPHNCACCWEAAGVSGVQDISKNELPSQSFGRMVWLDWATASIVLTITVICFVNNYNRWFQLGTTIWSCPSCSNKLQLCEKNHMTNCWSCYGRLFLRKCWWCHSNTSNHSKNVLTMKIFYMYLVAVPEFTCLGARGKTSLLGQPLTFCPLSPPSSSPVQPVLLHWNNTSLIMIVCDHLIKHNLQYKLKWYRS